MHLRTQRHFILSKNPKDNQISTTEKHSKQERYRSPWSWSKPTQTQSNQNYEIWAQPVVFYPWHLSPRKIEQHIWCCNYVGLTSWQNWNHILGFCSLPPWRTRCLHLYWYLLLSCARALVLCFFGVWSRCSRCLFRAGWTCSDFYGSLSQTHHHSSRTLSVRNGSICSSYGLANILYMSTWGLTCPPLSCTRLTT